MKHRPTVLRAMTPFPHWIDADQPMTAARQMMAAHAVHHLPTKHGGVTVGILRDTDVAAAADHTLVAAVHDPDPYVVGANDPLDTVVLTMSARHIDAAVVMRNGALAGILTTTDILRFLGASIRDEFGAPPGDDEVA